MAKKIVYNTPKGQAFWANLIKPETYKNVSTGKYSIKIMPSAKDASKLEAFLTAEFEKAIQGDKEFEGKKLKGEPNFGMSEDKDGNVLFKFKTNCEFTTKSGEVVKNRVPIFDSKGTPINCNIGNNSIIKVAFSIRPYIMAANNYGLTMYLEGIQVLDLHEYNGAVDAGALGFEKEDGYEAVEDNTSMADMGKDITDEECPENADF